MDKKTEIYIKELKIGSIVKLKSNAKDIHMHLDRSKKGYGQLGWTNAMNKLAGNEVYLHYISSYKLKVNGWNTYHECLDTNFKPK